MKNVLSRILHHAVLICTVVLVLPVCFMIDLCIWCLEFYGVRPSWATRISYFIESGAFLTFCMWWVSSSISVQFCTEPSHIDISFVNLTKFHPYALFPSFFQSHVLLVQPCLQGKGLISLLAQVLASFHIIGKHMFDILREIIRICSVFCEFILAFEINSSLLSTTAMLIALSFAFFGP